MKNKKETLSFREAWRRTLRAWRIWWQLCPGIFLSGIFCSAVKAAGPYLTIWFSARIVSELAGAQDPQQLLHLVLWQLLSAAGLGLAGSLLNRWNRYENDYAIRLDDHILMEKMMKLDYADMDRQQVHDLLAQIRQNEEWSGYGIYHCAAALGTLFASVFQILGGIALSVSLFLKQVPQDAGSLILLNHPLCAAGIIVLMLVIAVLSPACNNRKNVYWIRYASEARLGNRYFSFFGMMCHDRKRAPDLRVYRQQENVCSVYSRRGNMFTPSSSIARYSRGPAGLWAALSRSISMILTGFIYFFVCLKAWAGAFDVGAVTQYVSAITSLFLGISELLRHLGELQTNAEFLGNSFQLLDVPNKMYQGSLTTEKRSDNQYEIEFRDVSFRYPDTKVWALRHVNMKFRVGSRLAVVGMNGSGKTTFIKLLCRLYDPTEGQILLNGIDIRKYRYDDYIDLFSVVFQDFRLLALPLGENVAGAADYDRHRAEQCLKKAGLDWGSGSSFTAGLDTVLYKDLSANGVDPSGGEAQKIAIARALYKNAPFIILDEPTAALDPVTEAEIYSHFDEISDGRTVIYISHRLSSCVFCDEIAVFHEGAVIQQGSHEVLLADEHGKYHQLWTAQAQYYIRTSSRPVQAPQSI